MIYYKWIFDLFYTLMFRVISKSLKKEGIMSEKKLKKLCTEWPDRSVHGTWWVLVLQTHHLQSFMHLVFRWSGKGLEARPWPPLSRLHLQLHLLIFAGIQIFPTQPRFVLYCSERNGWLSILSINLLLFPWIPSSQRMWARENKGLRGQRIFLWLLMDEDLGGWRPPDDSEHELVKHWNSSCCTWKSEKHV